MMFITLMGLPIRLIKWPIGILYDTFTATSRRSFDLPPAGLDETKADLILFALRQSANSDQERAIADHWLSALEISQVAISRLIEELESVDFQLKFWTNRAEKGGHYWFSLTRHGPLAFIKQLTRLRPGSHGGNNNNTTTTAGGGDGYREMSASELVEKRILVFRLLRCSLCEALAKVQSTVGNLHLKNTTTTTSLQQQQQQQQGGDGGSDDTEDTGSQDPSPSTPLPSVSNTNSDDLFINARRCIIQAMVGVAQAFDDLDASAARALEHIIPPPATTVATTVNVDNNNAGQQQRRQYGDVLHFSRPDGKYLKDALSKILKLPQQHQHQHRVHCDHDQGHDNNDGFVTPSTTRRPPASHSLTISKKAASAAAASTSTVADPALPSPSQDAKTAAAFRDAQRAVGVSGRLPSKDCTVREVLSFAKATAQKLQSAPLIELPRWLKAPTTAQRHWIALTVGGALAGYGVLFLYRHSRLSGSRDLDNWAQQGVSLVGSAWKEHVIMPLDRVRGELFDTFRRRPAIVTLGDYEAERDSLQRMLNEFKADHHSRNKANGTTDGTTDSPSSAMADAGMDVLMRSYETQLRSPIRSLVGGDLARCVLIQVQKVKTDTQAAMLEIDQILRANELSISLVAAIPAFIVAGALIYGLSGYLTPTAPDPRREALPLRMALIDAERALQSIMIITNKYSDINTDSITVVMSEEAEGEFTFRLGQAWEEARSLFRKHRGLLRSGDAEWERMRSDMLELAAPPEFVRWEDKAGIAQRMMRNYAVLQR